MWKVETLKYQAEWDPKSRQAEWNPKSSQAEWDPKSHQAEWNPKSRQDETMSFYWKAKIMIGKSWKLWSIFKIISKLKPSWSQIGANIGSWEAFGCLLWPSCGWSSLQDFCMEGSEGCLQFLFSKTMVFMSVRDFDVKNIVGFWHRDKECAIGVTENAPAK